MALWPCAAFLVWTLKTSDTCASACSRSREPRYARPSRLSTATQRVWHTSLPLRERTSGLHARSSTPGLEVGAAGSPRWSREAGRQQETPQRRPFERCLDRHGRLPRARAIASLRTPVMQRSSRPCCDAPGTCCAKWESLDAARPTGWCFPQAQGLESARFPSPPLPLQGWLWCLR